MLNYGEILHDQLKLRYLTLRFKLDEVNPILDCVKKHYIQTHLKTIKWPTFSIWVSTWKKVGAASSSQYISKCSDVCWESQGNC